MGFVLGLRGVYDSGFHDESAVAQGFMVTRWPRLHGDSIGGLGFHDGYKLLLFPP